MNLKNSFKSMIDFFKRISDARKISKRFVIVCDGLTDIGFLSIGGPQRAITGTPIVIQCWVNQGDIEYTLTLDKSQVEYYEDYSLNLDQPLLLSYDKYGVYIPEYLMNKNGFGLINYALNNLETTLINASAALITQYKIKQEPQTKKQKWWV